MGIGYSFKLKPDLYFISWISRSTIAVFDSPSVRHKKGEEGRALVFRGKGKTKKNGCTQ